MKYAHAMKRITPRVGTGLAGFNRKPMSNGVYDDLYLQGLLLDDEHGERLLLFCADLIGFDSAFVRRMRRWITRQDAQLTAASVVFSATHTHCGPATCTFVECVGKVSDDYLRFLERSIKETVRELLGAPLKQGSLNCGTGRCGLAVNRRLKERRRVNGKIVEQFAMRPNPDGSIDHTLTVLQVKGKSEDVVLVNYACHPTTRGGYMISGDYPAAATRYLRASSYRPRHAMFLQGGAGDTKVPSTNADGTSFAVGDANQVIEYGDKIARAAERILKGNMRRITPRFAAARATFTLPYGTRRPEVADAFSRQYGRLSRWRARNEGDKGVAMDWTVWRLADDCVLAALPGEVCHMIGKRAKKISGAKFPLFLGYSNGNPCYIPTDQILEEGGYEGDTSMAVYGHPFLFAEGIDEMLDSKLRRAMAELDVG